MSLLLDVKGLTKRYGGLTANSDITFDVNAGEIVGIIGPNGAGKSTLFDLITNFQSANWGACFSTAARSPDGGPITSPAWVWPAPSRSSSRSPT